MKKLILFLIILFLIPQLAEAKKVLVIEVNGPITKGTFELFKSGLEKAEEIEAEALLVTKNTPQPQVGSKIFDSGFISRKLII